MENEARYAVVGGIVLLLLALLAGTVVWLMGGTDKTEYRYYSIYFHKQSMDGLDAKSAVKLRGVKVGDVTEFTFVKGSKEAVRVNIKVDANTPVHSDTTAVINRNLITGIAMVELNNTDVQSPLLTNVADGELYPLIQEGSSDLEKVATDATKVVQSSSEMLDKINLMLNDQNRDAVTQILLNTATFSGQLVQQQDALASTLNSFERAATQINQTAISLKNTTERLESKFTQVGVQSQATLQQVSSSFMEIQQQSTALSLELQTLSRSAQFQLKLMATDVHDVSDALTTTGQRYANPRALLLEAGKPATAPGE
ncbi:MlaD family protein [Thiomicrorhabdus aquaedulcis]|uniref:MlaD family protein n=1 Tax=Thiomicrorhabdus aquaedulcis TaxID=2211106 RepID=UPI000FDB6786|nr:MlaD family protein [Thiomicrorhabdus aquaedulcis]